MVTNDLGQVICENCIASGEILECKICNKMEHSSNDTFQAHDICRDCYLSSPPKELPPPGATSGYLDDCLVCGRDTPNPNRLCQNCETQWEICPNCNYSPMKINETFCKKCEENEEHANGG